MDIGIHEEAINLDLSYNNNIFSYLNRNVQSSSEPYASDIGNSINAMSISPSFNRIFIGGREILKILTADTFQETHNLRIGKAKNLCTHDVKWNPSDQYKDIVATASTSGHVLIWNVEIGKKSFEMLKQVVEGEHQRAVNRICWRLKEPYNLLTASQDYTMKLLDIRTGSVCHTFGTRCEIKDVQFNQKYTTHFASALENGNIQMWDIRNPSKVYREFTAHNGPIFTLAWSPTDFNVIASGGRDRLIKIWNLIEHKETSTIQTISSVHKVVWRPDFGDNKNDRFISSCSNVFDNHVHIWDIKSPYTPVASLIGAKDVTTSHIWTPSNTMIASSKDGFVRCFDLEKHCFLPNILLNSNALCFSSDNHLSCVSSKIDRTTNYLSLKETSLPNEYNDNEECRKIHMFDLNEQNHNGGFNPEVFKGLAMRYKFKGDSIESICQHNSEVAYDLKCYHLSQLWKILYLIFSDIDDSTSSGSTLNDSTVCDSSPVKDFDDSYDMGASASLSLSGESNPIFTFTPGSPRPTSFSPPFDDYFFKFISPLDAVDGAKDTNLSTHFDYNLTKNEDDHLEKNVISFGNDQSNYLEDDSSNHFKSSKNDKKRNNNNNENNIYPYENLLFIEPREVISKVLDYHESICDIQTCVYIVLIFYDYIKTDEEQISQWTFAYIKLLHRYNLWNISTQIIKNSPIQRIRDMNKQSTSYPTNCQTCKKQIRLEGIKCENCKTFSGICDYCHLPVKGSFAWCQVCGHGGHIDHMKLWFDKEELCVAGCSHVCNLSTIKKKQ